MSQSSEEVQLPWRLNIVIPEIEESKGDAFILKAQS